MIDKNNLIDIVTKKLEYCPNRISVNKKLQKYKGF